MKTPHSYGNWNSIIRLSFLRNLRPLRWGIQLLLPGLITVITIAILSPASENRAQQSGLPRFVSSAGRFSISLPDRFEQLTKLNIPTALRDAQGELYEWETKEATFGVGYADFFQPINEPESEKRVFDGATRRFRKIAVANNDNVAFRLLSDPEITENFPQSEPSPLPQTPEAPRVGSDADDEGLRGPVRSIRTESQFLWGTPLTKVETETRTSLTMYNEKGNKVRRESYDFKNNLDRITVYGYLDGHRVYASKIIPREYGPQPGNGIGGGGYSPSNKERDPRYDHRFEFKYDEKKRLTEETDFSSNGDIFLRYVYKYEGNQKEELIYVQDGSLTTRALYILDDKGNAIERTDFAPDGSVRSKISYTYEFDSKGNWTKRTSSWKVVNDKYRQLMVPSVELRTITYY
jgi:hypothetical protein